MGTVYFIARYDITDPDRYEKEYVAGVLRTLPEVGGRVIVATGSARVLEGGAPGQTVVLRFPSEEAFSSWYDGNHSLTRVRVETTTNSSAVLATAYPVEPWPCDCWEKATSRSPSRHVVSSA